MKRWLLLAALTGLALRSFAEDAPTLVFSGYIDYPDRHDYRIEIFTHPSGLISRVATYAGDTLRKSEEMTIAQGAASVTGIDRFQENLRTVEMLKTDGTIRLVVVNEDLRTRKKNQRTKTIRLSPAPSVLFADEEKTFSILPSGELRIEAAGDKDDTILVRGNQILNDGWYRSDWKRSGEKTVVQEYTTMETPGDWITDGGGSFTGVPLYTGDPATDAMNYYILDIYLGRPVFLPMIFGLETGSR